MNLKNEHDFMNTLVRLEVSDVIGFAKLVGIEGEELKTFVGDIFAQKADSIQDFYVEIVWRFAALSRAQKRRIVKMAKEIAATNKAAGAANG